MSRSLSLTRAQNRVLGALGDTARYAREARRDNMLERTLSEARYFIYGATGIDCENDREIARILQAAYDDQPIEEINA